MWISYLIIDITSRCFAALMILSFVMVFFKNKTRKNVLTASVIAWLIMILLNFSGSIDGRLLTLPLTIGLLITTAILTFVPLAILTAIVLYEHLAEKKWFAKKLPWVAGILYGFILFVGVPMTVLEQYKMQKMASELTVKQWAQMPEREQYAIGYKFIGTEEREIFDCARITAQRLTKENDQLLMEVIDICSEVFIEKSAQKKAAAQ